MLPWRQRNPLKAKFSELYSAAKRRARQKNLPFEIDSPFVETLFVSHCPVFDVPLDWTIDRGKGRAPLSNAPSIDRIDPTKGYTKDNVWIISHKANAIKNNATHEELRLVAEAVGMAIVNNLEW